MLSERIATVPLEEARRRREEVADLGRRLLPDRRTRAAIPASGRSRIAAPVPTTPTIPPGC